MFRFLFIILCMSHATIFAQTAPAADEYLKGMTEFVKTFDAAWNSHAPKQVSSFWVSEGDLITPWGHWIIGQKQIEQHFEQEKTTLIGKSTIQQSMDSRRVLSPNIVLLDTTIRLKEESKDETKHNLLHGTYIMGKKDNLWKIISLRLFQFQPRQPD